MSAGMQGEGRGVSTGAIVDDVMIGDRGWLVGVEREVAN